MRGYLSFLIIFASIFLIIALLELTLASKSWNFSKALEVEKASSISLNAKEMIIGVMEQNAKTAYTEYDLTHRIDDCVHCPESFCSPVPDMPNACDPVACLSCFREPEAREKARVAAVSAFSKSKNFELSSMLIEIGDEGNQEGKEPEIETLSVISPLARNGYALGGIRFRSELSVRVSSEISDLVAVSRIPRGTVIRNGIAS